MKRILTLLAGLVVVTAMALVVAPLALGDPLSGNKPTRSDFCPNDQYGDPVTTTSFPDGAADDVNGDGWVCMKTNAAKANGPKATGPLFIDNTAHNQNGLP